jgi:uncharacterized membrane protein YeaQ/YmgE (transglycosylase-associated protein family)
MFGMGILALCLLGLLAGAIAKWLLPGDDPGGFILTMLLGIGGSFLGGFIAKQVWHIDIQEHFFDTRTWVSAIGGALVILVGYRLIRKATR